MITSGEPGFKQENPDVEETKKQERLSRIGKMVPKLLAVVEEEPDHALRLGDLIVATTVYILKQHQSKADFVTAVAMSIIVVLDEQAKGNWRVEK